MARGARGSLATTGALVGSRLFGTAFLRWRWFVGAMRVDHFEFYCPGQTEAWRYSTTAPRDKSRREEGAG